VLFQAVEAVLDHTEAAVHRLIFGEPKPDTGEELGLMEGAEALLPLGGFLPEEVLGSVLELGFKLVDLMHQRPELFDSALIFRAYNFSNDPIKHGRNGKREARMPEDSLCAR
jgi:hypothetical protein